MEEINELYEKISKCTNISEKINMTKILNEMIEDEKNKLNNININNNIKIPIKYKKMSFEELEEAFDKSNINEKIIIYHAFERLYNNANDELFENE
jgi:hypothetical protein